MLVHAYLRNDVDIWENYFLKSDCIFFFRKISNMNQDVVDISSNDHALKEEVLKKQSIDDNLFLNLNGFL